MAIGGRHLPIGVVAAPLTVLYLLGAECASPKAAFTANVRLQV